MPNAVGLFKQNMIRRGSEVPLNFCMVIKNILMGKCLKCDDVKAGYRKVSIICCDTYVCVGNISKSY